MTIAASPDFLETKRETATIAVWRLYVLRAGYLLIAIGMGMEIVPVFVHHDPQVFVGVHGTFKCMLLALVLLSLLGLRYPLKMLPLLFWEMGWKAAWFLTVALPAWQNGTVTADIAATAFDCSVGAIFLFIVPWDYVWRNFVTAKSERFR